MISIDKDTKLIVFFKKVSLKEIKEAVEPFKKLYPDIENWEVSIQLGSLHNSPIIDKPIQPPFNFGTK